MNTPPLPPTKNITENKRKTKGKCKTSKTNHTFATKKVHQEKHEHKDTTWKKYHHQNKTATKQAKKTLVFPCFLATPEEWENFWGWFLRGEQNKKEKNRKMGQKTKPRKAENAIFPLIFWWFQQQELISGPGGGRFFDTARRRRIFFTPFFGGPISKAECTQTILYYKNRGFGTFGGPKKWAKI